MPRAAISELATELKRAGSAGSAHRLGHAIDRNLEELVLGPEDYDPILRALSARPFPGLEEFQRIVEGQLRQGGASEPLADELAAAREKRKGANEAFFRELNERLEERRPDSDVVVIVCECADEDCAQRLTLSRSEYEAVRTEPTQFVVAPGHVEFDIEIVVRGTERFEVVRKIGVGAQVAILLDEPDDKDPA